jgi:hypothetical protein
MMGAADPLHSYDAGVEPSIVVAKVRESDSKSFGYNARTDE